MLNIDRPLDDIIKESMQAKRADRATRRRDQTSKRKNVAPAPKPRLTPAAATNNAAAAPPAERSPDKDTSLPAAKARRPISKKRKNRRKPNASAPTNSDAQNNANGRTDPAPSSSVADVAPHYLSASAQRRSNGVKVVVSNLHPGVTQSDIAELFETVGPLKSAVLPRYANGTSSCEAEVIFENMPDALEAIKRYNLVPLDNQPLQITLVTTRSKNGRENNPSKKSQSMDDDYRDRSRSPDNENFERKESPQFADRNRNGQQGRRTRRRNRRQYRAPATGANQERDDRDRRDDRDGYAD